MATLEASLSNCEWTKFVMAVSMFVLGATATQAPIAVEMSLGLHLDQLRAQHGQALTSMMGKSGLLSFNSRGERSAFTVNWHQLVSEPTEPLPLVGTWHPLSGLMWRGVAKQEDVGNEQWRRRPLTIATVLSDPFTMRTLDGDEDQLEGFVIDLAHRVADIVGFNFTVKVVNGYGSMDENGKWNGMIAALLNKEADLAMADLTINYEREQVVDFTMPFMDLGIALLYVRSPSKSVNLLAFLAPLSVRVWMLMILAGLLVSLAMFGIAKLSPYETEELDSKEGVTPFASFRHCVWFTVASWVQQGCDFLPRATSSRVVASFWWFFTLIMISSYTANLAAFLTIERMDSPISGAVDLARQTKIEYGCVATGSTLRFFTESDDEIFAKLGRTMLRQRDEVLMEDHKAGVEKVLSSDGAYAYFMESVAIEYQVERRCQLTQIGGALDSKGYGVALPQGSQLRAPVSSAIIKLNEEGTILELKEKWWREQRGGGTCSSEETSSNVSALTITNVGGIFGVLAVGLFIGGAIALIERFWTLVKKILKT